MQHINNIKGSETLSLGLIMERKKKTQSVVVLNLDYRLVSSFFFRIFRSSQWLQESTLTPKKFERKNSEVLIIPASIKPRPLNPVQFLTYWDNIWVGINIYTLPVTACSHQQGYLKDAWPFQMNSFFRNCVSCLLHHVELVIILLLCLLHFFGPIYKCAAIIDPKWFLHQLY